jgi:hypothetical protein
MVGHWTLKITSCKQNRGYKRQGVEQVEKYSQVNRLSHCKSVISICNSARTVWILASNDSWILLEALKFLPVFLTIRTEKCVILLHRSCASQNASFLSNAVVLFCVVKSSTRRSVPSRLCSLYSCAEWRHKVEVKVSPSFAETNQFQGTHRFQHAATSWFHIAPGTFAILSDANSTVSFHWRNSAGTTADMRKAWSSPCRIIICLFIITTLAISGYIFFAGKWHEHSVSYSFVRVYLLFCWVCVSVWVCVSLHIWLRT